MGSLNDLSGVATVELDTLSEKADKPAYVSRCNTKDIDEILACSQRIISDIDKTIEKVSVENKRCEAIQKGCQHVYEDFQKLKEEYKECQRSEKKAMRIFRDEIAKDQNEKRPLWR